FACDAGGDVFSFIQQYERCSFVDAVKLLRERWGNGSEPLVMHTPRKVEKKPVVELTSAQQEAIEAANIRFLKSLSGFHPEVASQYDPYFAQTNGTGLDKPMDSEMKLSGVKAVEPSGKYHPDCHGIAQTYIDYEVGMAGMSVTHGFSAMAGRIIFPIRDAGGRLVGFAGRTTFNPTQEEKKQVQKYLNSKSDGLYKKSETLYGLFQAGNAIRNEGFCFLNEGYKDVLSMVAAGYPNSVAQCGAAFTNEQALLLKQYTNRVAVLMDADERGREIAAKAIHVLQSNGLQTCDLVLPPGEDPDSLFRRLGRQSFRAIIRESQLTDQIQSTTPKSDAHQHGSLQYETRNQAACDIPTISKDEPHLQAVKSNNQQSHLVESDTSLNTPDSIMGRKEAVVQGQEIPTEAPEEFGTLISDRPRLEAREAELRKQIGKLYDKRFITGAGPDRIQLNIDLMHLHTQLKQIGKQLNRPKVWYLNKRHRSDKI
ncbi:hypothetical protein A9168_06630, partial [Macellibacteroides sp. HH-ZS]